MYIRILISACAATLPLMGWAADIAEIDPISQSAKIYIDDLGATALRQTVALRVDSADQVALPAEVEFRCWVISPAEYDDVNLTLSISPPNGPTLYEGGLTVNLTAGEKEALLIWPAPLDLADGVYEIQIAAERPNGNHLASTQLRVRKLSERFVSDSVSRATEMIGALDAHVASLGTETFAPAVLSRLAIAHETVRFAQEAWRDANWPLAYDRALEAVEADAAVRAGLTFAALTPERFATSPAVAVNDVTIRNGTLLSASAPIFLYGVRLSLSETAHIAEIARFGMNAVVVELSPSDVLPESNKIVDLQVLLGPLLSECASLGVAVALQLQPQKMAGWALDQWPDMARTQFDPFYYDVTHPQALKVLEKFYNAVGAYVNQESRIFAVSVADAPRFRIGDELMRKGFVVHLREYYETDVALNLEWQTRMPSIDDIPIRWDWEKRQYQAHLQTYHRDQVTGFFSWIVNAFGGNPRNVPLAFTAPGSAFAMGSFKDGIDFEILNRMFAASGSESSEAGPSIGYAMAFPDAQMQDSLARSLNPAKPVFALGARVGNIADGVAGRPQFPLRERARIWQAAIDGVDLNVVPFESLFDISEGSLVPHDTRDLAGFISGGQSVNRLASTVQRFQEQPAPVAIVWSDSSRMLDNGSPYVPSLRRAYEGAACFGAPLRFISERQIAAGELSTVAILVLPEVTAMNDDAFDALDRYVAEGGRLVSTGSSVPYNAFANSRSLRLQASPLTKLVRGAENADNYLRALDAAFEASDLEEFPRAIDEHGYPMLGILSRYLEDDTGRYLYIVNLNPVVQRINLSVGRLEGRDLIDGRPVQFPLEIEPLDPMLILLTPAETETTDSESSDAPSLDPPRAVIEPVVHDS